MSTRLLPAILLAYILICDGFRIPLHLQHLDQRVLEKIAEKYGGNSLFYRGELIGNERTNTEPKSIHATRDAGIYFKKYFLNLYIYKSKSLFSIVMHSDIFIISDPRKDCGMATLDRCYLAKNASKVASLYEVIKT